MIRISKNGKLLYRTTKKRWENITNDASCFLTITPYNVCEIDEGVTLNDIFKIIKKNIEDFKNIYPDIQLFVDEINKRKVNEYNDHVLEIYRNINIDNEDEKKYFVESNFLHLKPKDGINDSTYSITFTPLNEIKENEIILNKKYKINLNGEEYSFEKEYCFIDIISTIIWEISWFGPPEKRNEQENKIFK